MYYVPGSDVNNSYENSLDALYQIANEPRLLVFCILYLTSIAFYNYFGLAVTKSLTGIHVHISQCYIFLNYWSISNLQILLRNLLHLISELINKHIRLILNMDVLKYEMNIKWILQRDQEALLDYPALILIFVID